MFEEWKWDELNMDAALQPLLTIIITTLIIFGCSFAYWIQNRNIKPTDEPKRYSMLIENFVLMIKGIVVETFGPKYVKWTPFFCFIFSFIGISNIIAITGLKEASISYTVPFTLGLTVWLISIFMGIVVQKWSYLKQFTFKIKVKGKTYPVMINPLQFLGLVTPLISISFRLWGNILAGYIIYEVVFWALYGLGMPLLTCVFIGGVVLMPSLMIYFSLFTGLVQAYVFTLLSVTYISSPVSDYESDLQEYEEYLREHNLSATQKQKKTKKQ